MQKRKILVAVLNWGLGHASRMVPVIKALEENDFEPVLASDGDALLFLRKEFPHLNYFELPSYKIRYSKKGKNFKNHFLRHAPLIFKAIIAEKRRIAKLVSEEKIHGIISDNRLGAYSKKVPSVYVTHQIKVFSGKTTFFSSRVHQFFIDKFSEVWVPDSAEKNNLSGKMGHGMEFKNKTKYLGIYSRFQKKMIPKKYDVLVLLSGPEPQRSILEVILLKEFKTFKGNILFVRGKIEEHYILEEKSNLEIHSFLTGAALETALNESGLVLARSGYSTLLDLAVLEKKAFFLPTPGQFEQEYLAKRMEKLNIAPYCNQQDFSLKKLEALSGYSGFSGYASGLRCRNLFSLFEGK